MISLRISEYDTLDEDLLDQLWYKSDKFDDVNAYDHPKYIERRVGFAIVKYYEEYYEFPHGKVPDDKETGDPILEMCPDCFVDTIYDQKKKEFYCPLCNE